MRGRLKSIVAVPDRHVAVLVASGGDHEGTIDGHVTETEALRKQQLLAPTAVALHFAKVAVAQAERRAMKRAKELKGAKARAIWQQSLLQACRKQTRIATQHTAHAQHEQAARPQRKALNSTHMWHSMLGSAQSSIAVVDGGSGGANMCMLTAIVVAPWTAFPTVARQHPYNTSDALALPCGRQLSQAAVLAAAKYLKGQMINVLENVTEHPEVDIMTDVTDCANGNCEAHQQSVGVRAAVAATAADATAHGWTPKLVARFCAIVGQHVDGNMLCSFECAVLQRIAASSKLCAEHGRGLVDVRPFEMLDWEVKNAVGLSYQANQPTTPGAQPAYIAVSKEHFKAAMAPRAAFHIIARSHQAGATHETPQNLLGGADAPTGVSAAQCKEHRAFLQSAQDVCHNAHYSSPQCALMGPRFAPPVYQPLAGAQDWQELQLLPVCAAAGSSDTQPEN